MLTNSGFASDNNLSMKGIDIDEQLQEALLSEIEPLPLKQCSSSTFWQHLLVAEKEDSNKNSTVGLREHDVIFGKCKVAHAHHGNKQFRRIIQEYGEEYQNTGVRDVMKRIANTVIDTVHQLGGRFMKFHYVDGDYDNLDAAPRHSFFEEVAYECQYQKVSHALRSARAPKTSSFRESSPSPRVKTIPVLSAPLPMEPQQQNLDFYDLLLRTMNADTDDALQQAIAAFESMDNTNAATFDDDELQLLFEL